MKELLLEKNFESDTISSTVVLKSSALTIETFLSPHLHKATTLLTAEEMFKLGDLGRAELVKGELIHMSPTGHVHGRVKGYFYGALYNFVQPRRLGHVLVGEVGIYTQRKPDTVRGADVVFISNERMAQVQSHSYLDVAPELIVEVLSPDDSWSKLMEKLDEYFAIGVLLIWVADPRTRQVYTYRSLTDVERFTISDTLSGGEVLPGFNVPVAELFNAK